MAAFNYEPISLAGPVSRLLRLHRGKHDEIKCDLFEAWIGDSSGGMPYSALSYTWGSSAKFATVTVNGRVMNVTTNLFVALQHLRLEDEDRILWVDAICIDQDNNQERTHQVQHMSTIYKEAEKVLIWLGEGNEKSDAALDAIHQLQPGIFHRGGDWRSSVDRVSPWTLSTRTGEEISDQEMQIKSKIYEGLHEVLERPWFRRVWILQEVANARVAIVHCGTKSVSARIFAQFPPLISYSPNPQCQAVLDIMPGLSRKESWWGQDRTLLNLLTKFGNSEASDTRDNIFALLGISSDAKEGDRLLPDYTKSLQDIVVDVAEFLSRELGFALHSISIFDYFKWNSSNPFAVFSPNQFHRVLLRIACDNEDEASVISLLTTTGIQFDEDFETLETLETPLYLAVRRGNVAIVKLLIEDGIQLADADVMNLTFSEAVSQGHEEIIRLLLDYYDWSFAHRKDAIYMELLLPKAAALGHEGVVKILLQYGTSTIAFDATQFYSDSPLFQAIEDGQDVWYKLHIEHTETRSIFKNFDDSLVAATGKGHQTIVKLLLEHGIQDLKTPRSRQIFNKTLSFAMEIENESIVYVLLDYASKRTPEQEWWANALCVAARRGRVKVLNELLRLGVYVDSADVTGTPLYHATSRGKVECVRLLLGRGAKLVPDARLRSLRPRWFWKEPLSCALRHRSTGISKLLIGYGAKIDVEDAHSETIDWLSKIGIKCELTSSEIIISPEERERLLKESSEDG